MVDSTGVVGSTGAAVAAAIDSQFARRYLAAWRPSLLHEPVGRAT
jgi:hypothetical protein